MNMERRYLEINDEDIKECLLQTNAWYALATTINNEFNIKEYNLWIGNIKWGGDGKSENIIAHYKKNEVFFTKGNEKHFDLISFIIHAWSADETVEINFNRSIFKTVGLIEKYSGNEYIWDIFDENLYNASYSFHMGELL